MKPSRVAVCLVCIGRFILQDSLFVRRGIDPLSSQLASVLKEDKL